MTYPIIELVNHVVKKAYAENFSQIGPVVSKKKGRQPGEGGREGGRERASERATDIFASIFFFDKNFQFVEKSEKKGG